MHLLERSVDARRQDDELAALAEQARAGSASAFDALARRVHGRVVQWAKGVTQDGDDADDVAQIVLLKLHSRLGQFRGRSRFTTWLYRVTRNVAFSRMHRERRRGVLLARRAVELSERDDAAGVGDDAERLAAIVQFVFAELPARQREVYELADLRGLNSHEIAERLGITASTARGLLMKARRRVRERMLESRMDLLEGLEP